MSAKLTPWFPAHIKPVRKGVYKISPCVGSDWFRRWDGANWLWGARTPEDAAFDHAPIIFLPDELWCGLARKPKEAA